MPQRILILTRDGVILTGRPEPGTEPGGLALRSGVLESISRLTHAGYHIVVQVTKPLDDAFTLAQQSALHAELQRRVSEAGGHIDAFFFCPHSSGRAACRCAPPFTGLLEDIAERWRVSLLDVTVVCGSEPEMVAASRAGAVPVLIDDEEGTMPEMPDGIERYPSLVELVDSRLNDSPE